MELKLCRTSKFLAKGHMSRHASSLGSSTGQSVDTALSKHRSSSNFPMNPILSEVPGKNSFARGDIYPGLGRSSCCHQFNII